MQSLTFPCCFNHRSVSLTLATPSRVATKRSRKVVLHVIQYRVVMCRGTVFWFLFDIFLTARAASLRHNLWSTILFRSFVCFEHWESKLMGYEVLCGKTYFSCAFDVCYKTSACKWHFPILSRRIAWERNDFFKAKRKIWENVPKNVSSFVNLHVKYVYAFQGNLALFEISFWPSFDLKLF